MKSICSDFTPKYCDILNNIYFTLGYCYVKIGVFGSCHLVLLSPVLSHISLPDHDPKPLTSLMFYYQITAEEMSEAWGYCSHCWKHHGVIFPTSLCHELENKYPQTSGHLGPLGIGSPGTHGHWVTWEPWDPFVWEEKLFSELIREFGWSCCCLCWRWGVKENDMML